MADVEAVDIPFWTFSVLLEFAEGVVAIGAEAGVVGGAYWAASGQRGAECACGAQREQRGVAAAVERAGGGVVGLASAGVA